MMTKFKINQELLIGGSSKFDALFLPVNIDSGHNNDTEQGYHKNSSAEWHHQHYHSEYQQLLQRTDDDDDGNPGEGEQTHNDKQEDLIEGPSSVFMHAITTDTPDSNDWCYRASFTSILAIIAIILFLVFGHSYISSLLVWLESSGPLISISTLMVLFIVISFPVAWGLQLLMLTAGYLYGLIVGPPVVTLCVTIGLLIAIPIMRIMCSGYLRSHFYSRKVEAIVNVVSGPHGMKVIALTRLTPIPFGLQNALFSLSNISVLRLLVSSVGGLFPMAVLNCYMGSTLRSMQDLMSADSNQLTGFFIFGVQILISVVLLWFVIRKARVELKKTMDESDQLSTTLPINEGTRTSSVEEGI